MNDAVINFKGIDNGPKKLKEEVVIGKDILDLITSSMYVNPLNVYREYVQNSIDAIDQAVDGNLPFENSPQVSIKFDQANRSVKIQDNGISIKSNEFLKRIISIGGSHKRGTTLRGFRGVGRLSGLGYCQNLIFRGRSSQEEKITEVVWDGKILKQKYRDQSYNESLGGLVRDIVSTREFDDESYPGRFFEVELQKVARLKNDALLNEELINNYLAQVSPVDFSKDFKFRKEINTFLDKHNLNQTICISIDDNNQVKKLHSNHIEYSTNVIDQITDVSFAEFKNNDDELLAVGWFLNHGYFGFIPKNNGISGIRLRKGNIQVGDDTIISDLFQESRFSGWVIGEIHILSEKITPNGRRDNFEPSKALYDLQNQISIYLNTFNKIIRSKSSIRNTNKIISSNLSLLDEIVNEDYLSKLPNNKLLKNAIAIQLNEYIKDIENVSSSIGETFKNEINDNINKKRSVLKLFKLEEDIGKNISQKEKLLLRVLRSSDSLMNGIETIKSIFEFMEFKNDN